MTCIVGLVKDKQVWIGGDSAATASSMSQDVVRDPKVFRNGPFLIGYTSSFRMGQLLKYSFDPPTIHWGQDLMEYMVKDFVPAVRELFEKQGFGGTDNMGSLGGVFLVGIYDRLFKVGVDFQVSESYEEFNTCGSGCEIAAGALYASRELLPEDRIRLALEAAARFDASVRPPFVVTPLTY